MNEPVRSDDFINRKYEMFLVNFARKYDFIGNGVYVIDIAIRAEFCTYQVDLIPSLIILPQVNRYGNQYH